MWYFKLKYFRKRRMDIKYFYFLMNVICFKEILEEKYVYYINICIVKFDVCYLFFIN